MLINQTDFENMINKFSEIEDVRDILWDKARILLLDGHEIEAYILILATWNTADFRYFLKNFNLEKFENTIRKISPIFNEVKNITFEKADFFDKNFIESIKLIYNELKENVRQTGASKIMALKNSNLFVMWDTEIRKMYRIDKKATPNDYIEFLKKMKDEFKDINWQNYKKSFAKAIDEYNYVKAEERRRKKK